MTSTVRGCSVNTVMAEKHALIPDPITMYTQKETMKEVKDASKNLMGGDFERQYGGPTMNKCDRRMKAWVVTVTATIIGLLLALLVLVIVREIHIARLRSEIDDLTANMIAMSANVKLLNQKYNNKHFNDFKPMEDTIYADEDQDLSTLETADKEEDKDKSNYDSLEKLHDITVLEEDNIGDDEDMLDVADDPESGDWYPDFDKRADKVMNSNMVHLRPDEIADAVAFKKDNELLLSNVRKIKKLLNENPENPDLPPLQPPDMTESSVDKRNKRSVFESSPEVDRFPAPYMATKLEERRKSKKFLGSLESASAAKMTMHTVPRTVRNSDDEEQRRPFIAAHFHGNTSHLNTEVHEHYKGNGLIRVSHGAPHDVWYPSQWTISSPPPRPTLTHSGHVRVHHTGVYLVYAQIYYLDSHDVISWVLHRTNPESDGRDTLLQCAQSSHSTEVLDKPNSCFSASALFLRAGDRLAVRNTGGDRHSLMQPEKSFIGLIKLADAEDPAQDL